MKIIKLLILLLLINVFALHAQKSITFKVENLTKPDKTLRVESYQTILEDLIRLDNGVSRYPLSQPHVDPPFNIVAKSNIADSLVSRGYHSFFEGMYAAYAEHRPFTLSPDMIWLLISQGFASHVNNNSEELRSMFVNFKDKTTLVVRNDKIFLDNPNSPWNEVFPEFSKQISSYTGKQLTETLTANFSTTTPITKIASQITLMESMKSYFNFVGFRMACGIPEITLEGTTQDWQHVLTKTEALRKYKLDWWVDEMEPVLKQFIQASKGKVDKAFWKDMFKYHSAGKCGSPLIIDGWIVKFFPYNENGKRNGLKEVVGLGTFPNEIVRIDLKYINSDSFGNFTETPLELWAGFVGLKQNNKTFGLKPEIGWMIRKKDTTYSKVLADKLKKEDLYSGGITIRVSTVPPELLHIGPIKSLTIFFSGDIKIPDEMANVSIGEFRLYGTITPEETERVKKLFPNTSLTIINKAY